MKVLVTGGGGFVGRWLARELAAAGHEVAAPSRAEVDVSDLGGLRDHLDAVQPDAVAHLAAVSFGPDARDDPGRALAINVGGTIALYEALRSLGQRVPVLVVGSSEEYGAPNTDELPLNEDTPLRPAHPYALSKVAQEAAALELGRRYEIPTVVSRSFNHTGPGQRPVFAIPALARRIEAVRSGRATSVTAGNIEVRRDLSDVRDVVVAYRLLMEGAVAGTLPSQQRVYNVASGLARPVRWWITTLMRIAGVDAPVVIDPKLVRPGEPEEIRGDITRLVDATGWQPQWSLETTLADVLRELRGGSPG